MINIKDFEPMFREFNRLYNTQYRCSSPNRDSLIEKCLEFGTVAEITEAVLRGGRDLDATLKNILRNKKIDINKTVSAEAVIETPNKETKIMETPNNLGNELQNVLMNTIAQFSVEKIMADVMPAIEKKCIEQFGMTPVVHEIKIGDSLPVTMKAELPPVFDTILASSANGVNVMMTGPAGTGKGYMARQVAKALEADFYEVNAVRTEFGLTGFVDANSNYVKTPFYDACKASSEGKKVVFLFDEIDCSDPESLKVFNEALEAGEYTFPNDEKLEFRDMVVLGACNTFGTGSDEMYVGNVIDASTRSRFVYIKVDYNRKIEEHLAEGDEALCDFIDTFRTQVEKCGLKEVICYRNIKQITKLKKVLPLKTVMQIALVKSIADDDLRSVLENIADVMGDNVYYRATKGENVKLVA